MAVAAALPAAAVLWGDQPPFGPHSYYGELSETAADRAAFAPLIKRFLGRPYAEARCGLIAMGFQPVHMRHPGDCIIYNEISRPDPELLACAAADFAGRSYVFRRPHGRGYAIVTTYGEEMVRVNAMRAANKDDLEDIRAYRAH